METSSRRFTTLKVLFYDSLKGEKPQLSLEEWRLRASKVSELIASTAMAFLIAGFVAILSSLSWPLLYQLFFPLTLCSSTSFRTNLRIVENGGCIPPYSQNPMGGIVGQYMLRPWQNELALMGQPTREASDVSRKSLIDCPGESLAELGICRNCEVEY